MPLVAYFCNKSQIVLQLCSHDFELFMQFHPSLSFYFPIIYASLVNSNYLIQKTFNIENSYYWREDSYVFLYIICILRKTGYLEHEFVTRTVHSTKVLIVRQLEGVDSRKLSINLYRIYMVKNSGRQKVCPPKLRSIPSLGVVLSASLLYFVPWSGLTSGQVTVCLFGVIPTFSMS